MGPHFELNNTILPLLHKSVLSVLFSPGDFPPLFHDRVMSMPSFADINEFSLFSFLIHSGTRHFAYLDSPPPLRLQEAWYDEHCPRKTHTCDLPGFHWSVATSNTKDSIAHGTNIVRERYAWEGGIALWPPAFSRLKEG